MSEVMILLEALGLSLGGGFGCALLFEFLFYYGPRIVCWIEGHKKFYYVGHTLYQKGEHVYWCGRCGHESSDEKDRRDHEARLKYYAMPGYAVRRYA